MDEEAFLLMMGAFTGDTGGHNGAAILEDRLTHQKITPQLKEMFLKIKPPGRHQRLLSFH